jgi:hypothetical protein
LLNSNCDSTIPLVTVDTTGTSSIDRNLTCDGCEYNLRGLQVDGRCPECALPIARSLATESQGVVSLRALKLARASIVILLLELFAAAGAGTVAFKLQWWDLPGVVAPIGLTLVAWASAIAVFILIAWMHRERQSVAMRWPWIMRHAGLVCCATSIAATATRICFPSRPMRFLILIGFLSIAVTPIPAMSFYTISKRLRVGRVLAKANLVCAIMLSVVGAWCALHIARDIPSAPRGTAFTAMPIAGVDYSTLLVAMLSRPWRNPFRPIGTAMAALRAIWIVMALMSLRTITRQMHRRQADVDERTSASSRRGSS